MTSDLRYPIGKYEPKLFSDHQKKIWLNDIKFLPQAVENIILNLDRAQLHTPYREGGWTVWQLVHHIADSHINAYCRFKVGLTEDNPTIKTYEEHLWAELDDVKDLPINISITLLYALHTRWYEAIRNLSDDAWQRTVIHPGQNKTVSLWWLLGNYAWHGKHHVAHIAALRERNNW
ncbi:MAG: putative metal-dependent hydrolase [Bacteroidetes bacterium]|nr:putative metal-dependent hydrolase [Bacteroidota bacterium]